MALVKKFIATVCAIGLIFASAFTGYQIDNRQNISASAEEVTENELPTTQPRASSGIDLSKYPTANLIPYPYAKGTTTINGVTFTVNNDGTVNVNGTATTRIDFILSKYISVTVGDSYFLSGCPSGGASAKFIMLLYDGTNGYADIGAGYKVVAKSNNFSVSIIIYEGVTVNNLVFKPMLNVGETAYPYSPPYDLIYNDGYNKGESAGHEAGYQDASDTLNLGIFLGATVSGSFTYQEGEKLSLSDGTPNFLYNSVNFNSIWKKYESYPGSSGIDNLLETAEITLNFKTTFDYYAFSLYFSGDSVVTSATFISSDGSRYKASIEKWDSNTSIGGEYALIKITDSNIPASIEVTALTIYFGRASDTLQNATVYSDAGGYLNGYDNGYTAGNSAGHTEGVLQGREEGYKQGETIGYENGYGVGYSDGLKTAETGDFMSLITAVIDAPVTAFTSLLDFEILGFNMRTFVLSLLTAALVIAMLRLFSGKLGG